MPRHVHVTRKGRSAVAHVCMYYDARGICMYLYARTLGCNGEDHPRWREAGQDRTGRECCGRFGILPVRVHATHWSPETVDKTDDGQAVWGREEDGLPGVFPQTPSPVRSIIRKVTRPV